MLLLVTTYRAAIVVSTNLSADLEELAIQCIPDVQQCSLGIRSQQSAAREFKMKILGQKLAASMAAICVWIQSIGQPVRTRNIDASELTALTDAGLINGADLCSLAATDCANVKRPAIQARVQTRGYLYREKHSKSSPKTTNSTIFTGHVMWNVDGDST